MAIRDTTDWADVHQKLVLQLSETYNRKAVKFLCQLGERVVKYARDDMSAGKHYLDQTGNLRSSIGYIVVQDGRTVFESGFKGTSEGKQEGSNYAHKVAQGLSNSKTYLVWVAGMEYASYVEARGYDVIQGSGDWLEANVEQEREAFRRYLKSKRE